MCVLVLKYSYLLLKQFERISNQLFQSFNSSTSVTSFDTLSSCIISWLEEYCKPQVEHSILILTSTPPYSHTHTHTHHVLSLTSTLIPCSLIHLHTHTRTLRRWENWSSPAYRRPPDHKCWLGNTTHLTTTDTTPLPPQTLNLAAHFLLLTVCSCV